MKFRIRIERETDHQSIADLIGVSFKNKDQVVLWEMLKRRRGFIKELSLLAEVNGIISGYVLLSPVHIQTVQSSTKSLWLEPVCVLPEFQKKGIGRAMISNALSKASSLGFESVFVTGSPKFYSKFGFKEAKNYGITPSVQIPPDAFLAIELKENSLKAHGILVYPEEIFD